MAKRPLRLFVALELPGPVREVLGTWTAEVVGAPAPDRLGPDVSGLRPVALDSLHVTLCFLGAQPVERLAAIREACEVARGAGVGELGLGEARWLPRRRPRVLAVELENPAGGLAMVQAELARALAGVGAFQAEARAFLAHVTVARLRRGAGARPASLSLAPAVRFVPEQVVLYRSHLGGGSARYEALHRVPLSGEIIRS